MSPFRRFRSAVTGLFVSRKDAQANPRETVSEHVPIDAVEELNFAQSWLMERRARLHDASCVRLKGRCTCGLHRVLASLSAIRSDLKRGL